MAEATGHQEARERPAADLMRDLSDQTTTLIRKEIELAKVEFDAKRKKATAGAGMFGGAALFGLFAFGALTAALVPVVLALTAVAAAFGLLGPVSQAFPLDDSVKIVVVLIGMAVGVDYALFYVIRSREERRRGLQSHQALERTASTSGRTVLVSGTTVAIAMAGMFIIGTDIFNGLASGTIAVIACAVAGSVTVLPGLLELLGTKIDLPHLRTETARSRFWPAVIGAVLRRPVLALVLSAGVLVALAVPALGLHITKPSDEALSAKGEPALATLGHVRMAFPSTAEPAVVVVKIPPGRKPRRSERRSGSSTSPARAASPTAPSPRAPDRTVPSARSSSRSQAPETTPRASVPSASCAGSLCRRRSAESPAPRQPLPARPRRMSTSRTRWRTGFRT
jgi:uncharacterized membrane protein YdfJ with MMPL/SSD domain